MEGAAKMQVLNVNFALPFSDAPRVLEEVDCIYLAHKLDSKAAIENWLLDVKQELSLLM